MLENPHCTLRLERREEEKKNAITGPESHSCGTRCLATLIVELFHILPAAITLHQCPKYYN